MLKDLQDVFRKSLAAFRDELQRREPEDQVAELLTLMRKELVSARANIPVLERAAASARAEVASEAKALDDCRRRRSMAERIGDTETVTIAAQFEARHQERLEMLEKKVTAAEAEHAMGVQEADEMMRRYKAADANRFGLLAELRRSAARNRMTSLNEQGGPMSDWERISDAINNNAAYADAVEELGDDGPGREPPSDVEARLEELKRKMRKG